MDSQLRLEVKFCRNSNSNEAIVDTEKNKKGNTFDVNMTSKDGLLGRHN